MNKFFTRRLHYTMAVYRTSAIDFIRDTGIFTAMVLDARYNQPRPTVALVHSFYYAKDPCVTGSLRNNQRSRRIRFPRVQNVTRLMQMLYLERIDISQSRCRFNRDVRDSSESSIRANRGYDIIIRLSIFWLKTIAGSILVVDVNDRSVKACIQ